MLQTVPRTHPSLQVITAGRRVAGSTAAVELLSEWAIWFKEMADHRRFFD